MRWRHVLLEKQKQLLCCAHGKGFSLMRHQDPNTFGERLLVISHGIKKHALMISMIICTEKSKHM